MESRALPDWLQGYLQYTENHEAPEKIHLWVGLSILSTALRRQVFMDRGIYALYPNLYVVFVAESAEVRKSIAIDMGLPLLEDAIPDIEILGGRMTPEGIVKHLNRTKLTVNPTDPSHPFIKQESHILIHGDELATLFGYDKNTASRMTILLTQAYGSQKSYKHTTKSDAQIILHNLYITLLAATDPRNLKVLPEDAIGGLIGRTIFVTSRERRRPIAWPQKPSASLHDSLVVDLARIGALSGMVNVTQEAKDFFEAWYIKFSDTKVEDPRLGAFHKRAHDTALKIAMLLSVSESNDLIVHARHVVGGIAFIEKQLPEFARIANWSNTSIFAQNRARFLDVLKRGGGLATKKLVLRTLAVNMEDLHAIENALVHEGAIFVHVIHGQETIYKLTPDELGRMG